MPTSTGSTQSLSNGRNTQRKGHRQFIQAKEDLIHSTVGYGKDTPVRLPKILKLTDDFMF